MQAVAEISLSALAHNLSVVRRHAPKAQILAMVKANAYGHGVEQCLGALADVDALGVAAIDEAQHLRELGWQKPIVVMEGCFSIEEWQYCEKAQVSPVLHHQAQLDSLIEANLSEPLTIWVEVDTGMHRLGFLPEEIPTLIECLRKVPHIQIGCWFSHFSDAGLTLSEKTKRQILNFQCIDDLPPFVKSLASSASVLGVPESHHGWIRPGLMLYGVSPIGDHTAADFGLKPAMCLKARVIAKRYVPASECVGYSSTWVAPEGGAWVATVSIGYGDGYPWRSVMRSMVEIHGKALPVIGRVSMDSLAVDISVCHESVLVADEVVLWGSPTLPVETIAKQVETIPYVLLSSLTERVVRSSC